MRRERREDSERGNGEKEGDGFTYKVLIAEERANETKVVQEEIDEVDEEVGSRQQVVRAASIVIINSHMCIVC